MDKYLKLIQSIIPDFNSNDIEQSFINLGVDSIDLVSIRVEFERHLGSPISDNDWTSFQSFKQLIEYSNTSQQAFTPEQRTVLTLHKTLNINMPQMAIESLSENWLFKEIGSIHWELLCQGLGVESNQIQDEMGNRLYATFVRIKFSINTSLHYFSENEDLQIEGQINRYGGGLYFSDINMESFNGHNISASLMTSFSKRGKDGNKNLVKSQPFVKNNTINELKQMPEFGNTYRLLKRGELNHLTLEKFSFKLEAQTLFETPYNINAYYDLNGVGLLYFAAYPIISDYCEAQYCNKNYANNQANFKWEESYFTKSRDILYYANCDIHETIIYKLHFIEFAGNLVSTYSALYRKSDKQVMAKIFTIKNKK